MIDSRHRGVGDQSPSRCSDPPIARRAASTRSSSAVATTGSPPARTSPAPAYGSCVLERRPILGGACVTEEVWPGARVSRASYVVSMLQPKVVADLRLRDYGYRAVPLDPAYAALTADGPIFFFNEPASTAASIARFSTRGRRGV